MIILGNSVILKLENTKHISVCEQHKILVRIRFSVLQIYKKVSANSFFSCCACIGLYFFLINSYRPEKITFYDKIAFYYPPAKFELAAANRNSTIANLVQPGCVIFCWPMGYPPSQPSGRSLAWKRLPLLSDRNNTALVSWRSLRQL